MSSAELSSVIADIYDAAIDPTLWQYALSRISNFVGGPSAVLFWHDVAGTQSQAAHLYNDNPQWTALYFQKYVSMNPLFPAANFIDEGKAYTSTDVIPQQEFEESRFYQEWIKPQGMGDAIAINLEKGMTRSSFICVRMDISAGFQNDEARDRLNLLAPHLQRAVAIGRLFDQNKTENQTLTEALDFVRAAVVLVKSDGAITFANERARKLLGESELIREQTGRLRAIVPEADRTLLDVFASVQRSDIWSGPSGIAVPLSRQGQTEWFAHVLPLTAGKRQNAEMSQTAIAAVFIRDAPQNAPSPLEKLSKQYKFTAGEVRVFEAVLRMENVKDMAQALGLSEATVKTHLQHLFQKTGVRSQRELVKLAGRS